MHELLAQIAFQERLREAERRSAIVRQLPPRTRRRWRLRSPIVLERASVRPAARPCL